jgi:hypothetical protein
LEYRKGKNNSKKKGVWLIEERLIKWAETADTGSGLYSETAVFLVTVKFLCGVAKAAVI